MDASYVAGLFDGEGCIWISEDLIHIQTSVTQKKTEILYLLKAKYGGNVSRYGKQACHKWRVVSIKDTLNFLEDIQPYVIIKASKVRIAIEFPKTMRVENKGYHPLDEAERIIRTDLRDVFYGHAVA